MIPRYSEVDDEPRDGDVELSPDDEELLKEIRRNYSYAADYWREVRRERNIDLRFIAGDPWDPADRKAREDPQARRPCISHDELSQYIHQSLNNVRHNKRGIKVEPAGEGADEKSAEYRQNRIRAIEYKCKAQSVYETGFQHMLEGSYGFWRINRRYVSTDPDNWDQEVTISAIPNPDSVLYDPNCKNPDWSDAEWCFVLEPMSWEQFGREWPDARRTDFTADERQMAKDWLQDKTVLVAEYWKVEIETRPQKRKNPRTGDRETRMCECRHVVQYYTNGLEILERREQPGSEIPIPACIGLERYIDEGAGSVRKIFSLVRLARDPQMTLAYLCSLEAECAGLTPKVPYVGYVGQFETDKKAWDGLLKIPRPYVQADPIPDSANGQILPPPRREPFAIDFGSFEVAKDSARRAIMAAMGISPLPTAAMRSTEKSGVAIQRVQEEQALGSYHFMDNFERAIERTGRIIESWLPVIDDTERDVALCEPDDTRKIVRINTPPQFNPQTGQYDPSIQVEEGEHDVTVSVGPSNQSQRDAANDQLQAMLSNLPIITQIIGPPAAAQLLAKSIQLMQLGPIGDQMQEIITPQQNAQIPPQAQQMMNQAQMQLQALNAHCQQLEGQNQQLMFERQAKILDNQSRLELEREKISGNITVAEINTKMQDISERTQWIETMVKELHAQAHEVAMQAHAHVHERQMAEHEHQNALEQAQMAQQAAAAQQQAQPNG